MIPQLLTRIRDEVKGEATLEYGLIIAVIAIICIGILLSINCGDIVHSNLTSYLKYTG